MGQGNKHPIRSSSRLLMLAASFCLLSCSSRQTPATAPRPFPPPSYKPLGTAKFDWPLDQGHVSSGFGLRHGAMHEGIDIAAPVGTPVRAAAAGRVIFAGRMRGYGRLVIIQHNNNYVTVYAHDSANLVREGDRVRRGQIIGRVGRSGHTTGANLHFEVRHNNVASNPLLYLPPLRAETRMAGAAY